MATAEDNQTKIPSRSEDFVAKPPEKLSQQQSEDSNQIKTKTAMECTEFDVPSMDEILYNKQILLEACLVKLMKKHDKLVKEIETLKEPPLVYRPGISKVIEKFYQEAEKKEKEREERQVEELTEASNASSRGSEVSLTAEFYAFCDKYW